MDSAVGVSISLGPPAADVLSAVGAHARALQFDTPFMGVSKGADSANKDAFTPPVLVLEVADGFSKRDPAAWGNLTDAIWRTVCKGRDVTYRGTNVNFGKTQKPNKKMVSKLQASSSLVTSAAFLPVSTLLLVGRKGAQQSTQRGHCQRSPALMLKVRSARPVLGGRIRRQLWKHRLPCGDRQHW